MEKLKPIFNDGTKAKIAHNGKFDMEVLAEVGINVTNLASDTMIAAYLLSEPALGLKSLAFSRLNVEMTPITSLIGTGSKQIPMSQVEIEKAVRLLLRRCRYDRPLERYSDERIAGPGIVAIIR